MKGLFTSEYVSLGHPDKVADQIAAAIVKQYLQEDPNSHCGLEVLCGPNKVVLAGEVKSAYVMSKEEAEDIVMETIKEIGYTRPEDGFSSTSVEIENLIHEQSPDIAQGVEGKGDKEINDEKIGSGDQGIMAGYAVKESPEFMPWTHKLAHDICLYFYGLFKDSGNLFLRPDIKTQVTLNYQDDGISVETIVVSASHDATCKVEKLREFVIGELENYFKPYCEKNGIKWENPKYFINPTGRFVEHGPYGDSGITGRKLTVDTYGGRGYHGGGAFINKDPTKTDMSALVTARWIAKSVVASGLATECDVQLAYAIGVPYPVSVNINTKGTGTIPDTEISDLVTSKMDLSVQGIIDSLKLREMDYTLVNYTGPFYGDYPWEHPVDLK